MNGFLLIARCNVSEIPLRLFASRDEAEDFLLRVAQRGRVQSLARHAAGDDAPEVRAVSLVEFRGGQPLPAEELVSFDRH
jgi:hypothetical protein